MDVLTTDEAAKRLGVSSRRVRALIAEGDLQATQVGRSHLVEAESRPRLECQSGERKGVVGSDDLGGPAERSRFP